MNHSISVSIEDCLYAKEIYELFSRKPGSEHIASEVSLQYLTACLRLFKPSRVLELGAGIGTITETVLSHPCAVSELVSTETDPYCLSVLRNNLRGPGLQRLTVVTTPSELSQLKFVADMIIGDGGFYSSEELSTARVGTIFFTEGRREKLRNAFTKELTAEGRTITFINYGSVWKWENGFRRRLGRTAFLPRFRKTKGCWIGVVCPFLRD